MTIAISPRQALHSCVPASCWLRASSISRTAPLIRASSRDRTGSRPSSLARHHLLLRGLSRAELRSGGRAKARERSNILLNNPQTLVRSLPAARQQRTLGHLAEFALFQAPNLIPGSAVSRA